ncbi:hypothetical protein [Nocardioides campestrisoli]|uniref:hypothetical protein n=1 Tax=Nocardioides campestrisoli TaxID=2736757 RepID=UPI001CD2DC95|nr:hypothetical protein [Nocardioides campestrisoli]
MCEGKSGHPAFMLGSPTPEIVPRMKQKIAVLALPLLAAATVTGAALVAAPAYADELRCAGSLGATTVDDDLVVASGTTCRLNGTRVEGNIEVKSGATLIASGVRVDGNIQGENFTRVVVKPRKGDRSRVDGNIQLEDGGKGRIVRSVVDGDIQLEDNAGRFVVRRNVVDGNLQCEDNSVRPVGNRNRVAGDKEGQCRRM